MKSSTDFSIMEMLPKPQIQKKTDSTKVDKSFKDTLNKVTEKSDIDKVKDKSDVKVTENSDVDKVDSENVSGNEVSKETETKTDKTSEIPNENTEITDDEDLSVAEQVVSFIFLQFPQLKQKLEMSNMDNAEILKLVSEITGIEASKISSDMMTVMKSLVKTEEFKGNLQNQVVVNDKKNIGNKNIDTKNIDTKTPVSENKEASSNKPLIEIVKNTSQSNDSSKNVVTNDFSKAINTAKELAKTDISAKTEPVAIDIDALQKSVEEEKFLNPLQMAKSNLGNTAEITPKNAPEFKQQIIQQVRDSIVQNSNIKNNEFTIKLKPEGLGEIVIKMTNSDNKLKLNIITSSVQVQQLISDEVGRLTNALKPFNGEIMQIATNSANETTDFTKQHSEFGQGLQEQEKGYDKQNDKQSHSQQDMMNDENEVVNELPELEKTMVDTYI